MKNNILLDENAQNIGIFRDVEKFRLFIKDLEADSIYYIEEKEDVTISTKTLAFGFVSLPDFINKQLPKDVKTLKQLETDNLYAEAKLNATTLMISGKMFMNSKYATREELYAFQTLLNKHEKYLLATIDETIEIHNESIGDAYMGSNVSR